MAIIPFVCNILPILWITDSTLVVGQIDEDFYHSIPRIREGYAKMYPKVDFRGNIEAAEIVRERFSPGERRSLLFFSGGVDANSSLIAHRDESPCLMTIWGADITPDNETGWQKVHGHTVRTATEFGLPYVEVKSNFRTFLDPSRFGREKAKWDNSYWHRLQHGIGLIGHAAPYAFLKKMDTVYLASSYSPLARQSSGFACASDPTIDECLAFCGATVLHDQADLSRQDKVNAIVAWARTHHRKPALRVCWQSDGGENCCLCEKCHRTILALIVAGGDPNDYGFSVDAGKLKTIGKTISRKKDWHHNIILLWEELKQEYRKGNILPQYEPYLDWLGSFKMKRAPWPVLKIHGAKYRLRRLWSRSCGWWKRQSRADRRKVGG